MIFSKFWVFCHLWKMEEWSYSRWMWDLNLMLDLMMVFVSFEFSDSWEWNNTWNRDRELPMKLQDFLFWANFVEDMDQIRKTMMQHEALFKEQVWRFCLIYPSASSSLWQRVQLFSTTHRWRCLSLKKDFFFFLF